MLSDLDFDKDPQSAADVGPAYIVLSALTSELFLKCLICIETGEAQTGHHLSCLYGRLSQNTQARIKEIWDNDLVKYRASHWDKLEAALGRKIDRSLLAALKGADTTFEKMRYGYENNNEDVEFYLSDFPRLLGRVIVELKPEYAQIRRGFSEVKPGVPLQKQKPD
jgi:hypothetical protein